LAASGLSTADEPDDQIDLIDRFAQALEDVGPFFARARSYFVRRVERPRGGTAMNS